MHIKLLNNQNSYPVQPLVVSKHPTATQVISASTTTFSLATKKIEPYSTRTVANSLGLDGCSWIVTPLEMISATKILIRAIFSRDEEGIIDATIRLAGTPVVFVNGCVGFVNHIVQIGTILKTYIGIGFEANYSFLSLPISSLGVALSAIGVIYEGYSLSRSILFIREIRNERWGNASNEKEKEAFLIEDLEAIHLNYFNLTEKEKNNIYNIVEKRHPNFSVEEKRMKVEEMQVAFLAVKRNNLGRRVEEWCANELERRIPFLLQLLKSNKAEDRLKGREQAEELLNTTLIQARKNLIITSIGLVSILLSVISFIFTLLPFGPLIPLVLFGVLILIGGVQYLLKTGMLDERGWNFSFYSAIPWWLKGCCSRIESLRIRCFGPDKPIERHPPPPSLLFQKI